MQENIELLVKLQAVELERIRLNAELKKLPVQIVAAQNALKAAEKLAAEAQAALEAEEKLRARLESELNAHRAKATRLRVQLDSVTTPAQAAAMEHEIEFATSEADRLETDALLSLDRTETQEEALTAAKSFIDERQANLKTIREIASRHSIAFQHELVKIDAEALRLRPLIDEESLTRFDRIAKSRGSGLARADKQQCSGCSMGLRLQIWNKLREGEMHTCDNCGRLLYWDPAIAPAAEEERPELAPGAGQALRRPKQN